MTWIVYSAVYIFVYFYPFLFGIVNAAEEKIVARPNSFLASEGALCPDGTQKIVTQLQRGQDDPFQPDIVMLDCPSGGSTPRVMKKGVQSAQNETHIQSLQRRQACSLNCSGRGFCRQDSGASAPGFTDCKRLYTYLTDRGASQTIGPGQQVIATAGTCALAFTNELSTGVTWCDSAWGSQGQYLTETCILVTTYGACSIDGAKLEIYHSETGTPSDPTAPLGSNAGITTTPGDDGSTTASPSSVSNTSTVSTASLPTATTTSRPLNEVSLPGIGTESNSVAPSDPSTGLPQYTGNGASAQSKNIAPIVAGVIVGVAVVILILVALWLWRKRKQRMEKAMTFAAEQDAEWAGQSVHPMSELSTLALPTSWTAQTRKPAISVSQKLPVPTDMSSAEPLLGSDSLDPSSSETGSRQQNIVHSSFTNENEDVSLPRQSFSTRGPGQVLASELSDNEIIRLADSIVARMQGPTNAPVRRGDPADLGGLGSPVGASEINEEPPPPWRASWGGNNQPVGPPSH
ncbi:hypothetical protein FRC18_007618 [Serendipita sp. 400]|nr:hypothetical protein FRC18_007618 [Serendipita sp. 400]